MGAKIPKQYIKIGGREIALYSLDKFAGMELVGEVIVVCEEEFEPLFRNAWCTDDKPLKFARPGKERQDSAFNGFAVASDGASLIAIHDSARPLFTADLAAACFHDAHEHGAAVLGVSKPPTPPHPTPTRTCLRSTTRTHTPPSPRADAF